MEEGALVKEVVRLFDHRLSPIHGEGEARAITRAVFFDRMGWDAAQIELHRDEPIHGQHLIELRDTLERLGSGEPIQHVLGEVEFHGLRLRVTPNVLIPRPETEELVELVIRAIRPPRRAVDLCTGSGCVALALKNAWPNTQITGVEVSDAALEVARANAAQCALLVEWFKADVLDVTFELPNGIDLVVSNPPYIPPSELASLDPHVRDHEPHLALFTPTEDALVFYRAIAGKAVSALVDGGELWFECHFAHARASADVVQEHGYASVEVIKDMNGHDRFIRARR